MLSTSIYWLMRPDRVRSRRSLGLWNDNHMQRRSFLGLGLAGGISPAFSRFQSLNADTLRRTGRAKQVIVVFEQGGMSHIDTWDPKPETAVDHRSPYQAIQTGVPGIHFTELCSRTARHADKLAVVRSMSHQVG